MWIKRVGICMLAAFGTVTLLSQRAQGAATTTPNGDDLVARVHWLGKQRMREEPTAAYVMHIWQMPASMRLQAQTLDKLAIALTRLGRTPAETKATDRVRTLFRPLLNDMVDQESFFDLWEPAGRAPELALSIRLDHRRSALWETNLAGVVEELTGARPVYEKGGWRFDLDNGKTSDQGPALGRRLRFYRSGGWTLLGLAASPTEILNAVLAQMRREGISKTPPGTNDWLTTDLDLTHLAKVLGWPRSLPPHYGRLSLAVNGVGGSVRTHGEVKFQNPLPMGLRPWNMPTNLVQEPLIAFTAARGLREPLASSGLWDTKALGEAPDEVFSWALDTGPLQAHFASPIPQASEWVKRVSEFVLRKVNPILDNYRMGKFAKAADGNGVKWAGAPLMAPYLEARQLSGGGFAVGGLLPFAPTNRPAPKALYQAVLSRKNLVCYDWELTQPRVADWVYLGQVFRLLFEKAQMPASSAGLSWLLAVAPKLGNCVTVITRSGPSQLSFVRQSSLGFKAVELHLLVDWLESPRFPHGLHTLLAPNLRHTERPSHAPSHLARPQSGAKAPPTRDIQRPRNQRTRQP